jgi:rRNA maturation protein Nop10
MGRSYLFECPKCGYRAKVSGGADRGFGFFVQTILCRDCNALHDAVIRVRISGEPAAKPGFAFPRSRLGKPTPTDPPTFDSVLNRLKTPAARPFRWMRFPLRCPVSAAHKIRAWNEPDKCPRCGTHLEKSALPFRIWE